MIGKLGAPAVAVFVGMGLAGCIGEPQPDGTEDLQPLGCPLYPDNTTFDCQESTVLVAAAAQGEPEHLGSGWSCLFQEDRQRGLADGTFRVWRHEDGRAGTGWEFTFPVEEGKAFIQTSIYYGHGDGLAVVTPFTPTGFVVWPENPRQEVFEAVITLRQFKFDAKVGDGEWELNWPAQMRAGAWGGDPWYVQAVETPRGQEYVNLMRYDPDDEGFGLWSPRSTIIEEADRSLAAHYWGAGVHVEAMDISPGPGKGLRCQIT